MSITTINIIIVLVACVALFGGWLLKTRKPPCVRPSSFPSDGRLIREDIDDLLNPFKGPL